MFHRFASALFGDDVDELSRCSRPGDGKEEEEEEEEDWILVNYLADACSGQRDDLVMIPSPAASPAIRYASCTSLNSTADTDLDGGSSFLHLDACSLEESWFVTPPPCFTGSCSQPVHLEASPLENLLIEHPSMSVYAHRSPPRLTLDPLPCSLDREPEVAMAQRRSGLHSACYAAALSARAGLLLPQRTGNAGQRLQPLSRNALRRLNRLRPPKASAVHLHQPGQRHLNF
uniref:Tumor protein p53 inducible nuclear protein 1 n=1 Tax=Scophthalmus maximus TaxID=52904 RepID=A0A8D3BRB2_SCOMX